jgi:hypothetical protein
MLSTKVVCPKGHTMVARYRTATESPHLFNLNKKGVAWIRCRLTNQVRMMFAKKILNSYLRGGLESPLVQ